MEKTFEELFGNNTSETYAEAYIKTKLTFKTKDEYLAWKNEWKNRVKATVCEVRDLRKTRKMYIRDNKGVVIGPNPLFSTRYPDRREYLRETARNLYIELYFAKQLAREQYNAAKMAQEL